MTATYINDNKSSIYPFATGSYLPFSNACIIGAGVCVQLKTSSYSLYSIIVTGVEIGDSSISLVLSIVLHPVSSGENKSTLLRVTASQGESISMHSARTDECLVTAWVVPGTVSKADCGTYQTALGLDRSVVTVLGADYLGHYNTVTVDGVEHEAAECIELDFSGVFWTASLEPRTVTIDDTTSIPEDYGITVKNESIDDYYLHNNEIENIVDDYDQVRVIKVNEGKENGTAVEAATGSYVSDTDLDAMGYGSTLHIKIEAPDGTGVGPSQSYITCRLENVIPVSDIVVGTADPDKVEGTTAGVRDSRWICRNDSIGDTTVLTIYGTHGFPNCYGGDDDLAGNFNIDHADGRTVDYTG